MEVKTWLWGPSWAWLPSLALASSSSGSLAGYLTFQSSVSISAMDVTRIKWTSAPDALAQGLAHEKMLIKCLPSSASGTSAEMTFPCPSLPVAPPMSPQLFWVLVSAGVSLTVPFPRELLPLCPSMSWILQLTTWAGSIVLGMGPEQFLSEVA